MEALVTSGRLADLILALVVDEGVALVALPRLVPLLGGVLPPLQALWPTLLSGALLVLALRFALTGAGWTAIAGTLAAAGIAHLSDLILRAKRP